MRLGAYMYTIKLVANPETLNIESQFLNIINLQGSVAKAVGPRETCEIHNYMNAHEYYGNMEMVSSLYSYHYLNVVHTKLI